METGDFLCLARECHADMCPHQEKFRWFTSTTSMKAFAKQTLPGRYRGVITSEDQSCTANQRERGQLRRIVVKMASPR